MTSLKEYIKDNPHILKNRDRIQGVLSDFLSADKVIVKRLMKGYDNGIIDVLNEENVDEDTKNRFVYKLIRKEDLIQDVAIEIFDEWADILGRHVLSDNKINNNNDVAIISKDDKANNNVKINNSKIKDFNNKKWNQVGLEYETNRTINNELKNHSSSKKQNRNNEKRQQIDKIILSWQSSIFYKSENVGIIMFIFLVGGIPAFGVFTLYNAVDYFTFHPVYIVLSFIASRAIFFVNDLEEIKKMDTKLNLIIELIWRFISYYVAFPLFVSTCFCLALRSFVQLMDFLSCHQWRDIELGYALLCLPSFTIYMSYKIYLSKYKHS